MLGDAFEAVIGDLVVQHLAVERIMEKTACLAGDGHSLLGVRKQNTVGIVAASMNRRMDDESARIDRLRRRADDSALEVDPRQVGGCDLVIAQPERIDEDVLVAPPGVAP